MGDGETWGTLPIIIAIIGLVLLQYFFSRRRRSQTVPRDISRNLLSEVMLNQALAGAFSSHWRVKKFETVSWRLNKAKMGFLDQSLQTALSEAFAMIEDFNRQITAAKKYKLDSYLVNINTDKLKKSLTRCQEGLEQWVRTGGERKEPSSKSSSVFDSWLRRG